MKYVLLKKLHIKIHYILKKIIDTLKIIQYKS